MGWPHPLQRNRTVRIFYTFILGLLLSLQAFASDAPTARRLVGSWRSERPEVCVLRFMADGTFSGHVDYKGSAPINYSGTWSSDKDRIFYTYKTPAAVLGVKDEDTILKLEETFLITRNKNGEDVRYDRISEG